jgi:GNAT superfamily N-acetyltransferase
MRPERCTSWAGPRLSLDRGLVFGSLAAIRVDDARLPSVVSCVRACRDYFARTSPRRSMESIAEHLAWDALADPLRRLFVIEEARGIPIGLLDLALDIPVPDEATVRLLVLEPGHRGLGFGREIAEGTFWALGRAGYKRVRLGVARGESEAAHFWASIGLWEYGEEDGVRLFEKPL